MNEDVLECKRKAQELITSDRAPVNGNGRKKGYIEVMKDLYHPVPSSAGLQMMHVELALYWILRNGGTPSTPLVQTSGIFPTPRNVGLSQRQIKRQASKKCSRTRLSI